MRKAVVTGGAGYFGLRLGLALREEWGCDVLLLDLAPPVEPLPTEDPGIAFAVCDVRDGPRLMRLFQGADVVFHCASYGMSGAQQLRRALVEEVNVGGTAAVIQACLHCGVERLVYTSTCNVVFVGQPIAGGDERLPYFPSHRHPDCYSRTKALAEQAVLAANGTPFNGAPPTSAAGAAARRHGSAEQAPQRPRPRRRGAHAGGARPENENFPAGGEGQDGGGTRRLRTCAVRATGIWGAGEQRHLPRVADYTRRGLFRFTFGPSNALVDFVHVDNLVQAHLLAAQGLGPEREHAAAGQAYFATDSAPLNNFAFFEPLVDGLGHPRPALRLPLWLVYAAAWLLELLFAVVGRWWDFSRLFLLTRAEAFKAGQHHWFSINKARTELWYCPRPHAFQPVVEWFLERGHGTPAAQREWAERREAAAAQAKVPAPEGRGLRKAAQGLQVGEASSVRGGGAEHRRRSVRLASRAR